MNRHQYLEIFCKSFNDACTKTKMFCFIVTTLLLGFVDWKLGFIPLFILCGTFIWALSKFRLLQSQVIEIKTERDLDLAWSLYHRRMKALETHKKEDIIRWWEDEQKRKAKDLESREIFLEAKQDNIVWWILFATYSNDFVNIYAYADKKDKMINKEVLEDDLITAFEKMIIQLPICRGILIEVYVKQTEKEGIKIPLVQRHSMILGLLIWKRLQLCDAF